MSAAAIDTLEQIFNSKEYIAYKKCLDKSCSSLKDTLRQQLDLLDKLAKVSKDIEKLSFNDKDFVQQLKAKTLELSTITKQMTKLDGKKDLLLCSIDKCKNEYVNLQMKKNSIAYKKLDEAEKKLRH